MTRLWAGTLIFRVSAVYLILLLSGSALLIAIFSFFYFRSYLKRRTGQERILSEFRAEVNGILKSIDETTERDISLIEEREKNLNNLLSEIDKRLKVYIRELEQPRTYEALGKDRYRISQAAESSGQAEATIPREATIPVAQPTAEPPPAAAPVIETPSIPQQIRSLLNTGHSVSEIASRLGISIAEAELAAALHKF